MDGWRPGCGGRTLVPQGYSHYLFWNTRLAVRLLSERGEVSLSAKPRKNEGLVETSH
jgi:hypothetical protein